MSTLVVLLHGIGHSRWNMYSIERTMRKAEYDVLNVTYPSRKYPIDILAKFIHDHLQDQDIWDRYHRVHFVTHSMGGLVTRRYLEKYKSEIPDDKLGRVVMLAPPNKGSEIADFLKKFPPYQWSFGPAGQELTSNAQSQNNDKKPSPRYELGIIAGSKHWPYIVANFVMKGAHDGRVAVEKTKLKGMKDHLVVPATHSFISCNPSVHKQILKFLKDGTFQH